MTEVNNTFKDIPCTFCGCLCDDIIIEIEDGKIVKNTNGCAISKERFVGHMENRCLHPTIGGSSVSLEKAIERAVEIISSSKRLSESSLP